MTEKSSERTKGSSTWCPEPPGAIPGLAPCCQVPPSTLPYLVRWARPPVRGTRAAAKKCDLEPLAPDPTSTVLTRKVIQ